MSLKTGGTHDWRQFRIPLRAADVAGCSKLNVFFYNDRMGARNAWPSLAWRCVRPLTSN